MLCNDKLDQYGKRVGRPSCDFVGQKIQGPAQLTLLKFSQIHQPFLNCHSLQRSLQDFSQVFRKIQ